MPIVRCNYDLLAIDLDGTLLGSDHAISPANAAAVRAAKDAGLRVCVCTGRGYNECKQYIRKIGQTDPVIVAGGAIVADAGSGRTLHRFTMNRGLVGRLVDMLVSHGHAALILKDPTATRESGIEPGHDYVIVSPTGEEAIDPVSRWWFQHHDIRCCIVPDLGHDRHPEHTVRVGVCGTKRETDAAARELRESFGHEVSLHHFGAVAPAAGSDDPNDQIVILEAFDKAVNKWTAIQWLAKREGIDPARVATIGNDINDVVMLDRAGLGVAMGNAIPECLAVADRTTRGHVEDGVAHAIERILAGEW